jgi:hypothetical protein
MPYIEGAPHIASVRHRFSDTDAFLPTIFRKCDTAKSPRLIGNSTLTRKRELAAKPQRFADPPKHDLALYIVIRSLDRKSVDGPNVVDPPAELSEEQR